MNFALAPNDVVWSDSAGSIWVMPKQGGKPRELNNQRDGDNRHAMTLAWHRDAMLAAVRTDLLRVDIPDGPVKALSLALAEDPLEVESDGTAVYVTLFRREAILRLALDGTPPVTVTRLRSASIKVLGDTLYAAAYGKGVLISVPTAGGRVREIAKGLPRPTGLDVDAEAAYVYCEKDETLRRIDLATGKSTVIATELVNADVVVADETWVYTYSWLGQHRGQVIRVAKDGSQRQLLLDELSAPYNIAIDDTAVWITVRDDNKLIRLDKQAIRPL